MAPGGKFFLLAVRSYTISYTKQKHYIKTKTENNTPSAARKNSKHYPGTRLPPLYKHTIDPFSRNSYNIFNCRELEGYIVRSRLPPFEDKEPNYCTLWPHLEKSRVKANLIPVLLDTHGNECYHTDELLNLTHGFFTLTYIHPLHQNSAVQWQLLQKGQHPNSQHLKRQPWMPPLTIAELTTAVNQLPTAKDPR